MAKRVTRRVQRMDEKNKRDLHRHKRKLEQMGIDIWDNKTVPQDSYHICVESIDEFNIGESAINCDLEKESYFVTQTDYETHWED